ncbi:MAG: hypothetical protein ACUVWJ_02770 [Spirochaetota bacterium]
MLKKSLVISLVFAFLLMVPSIALFALYGIEQAESDLAKIAQGLSDIFGPNLGSMTFICDPVGYSTIPHLALGVAGGIAFIPAENISLGTSLEYDFGDLKAIPLPAVGAYGKINLKGLEVGAKLAGIPQIENKDAGFEVNNMILGGKVRLRIIDKKLAVLRMGLSAGGFFDYINGNISMIGRDTIDIMEDVTGDGEKEKIGTVETETGFKTVWKGFSAGGEAQANFQLLLFNFFAGGRVGKSFGKATTKIGGTTTLYEIISEKVTPGSKSISITKEAKPEGIEVNLFGGAEVKLLIFSLGVRGGYNIKNGNFTVDGGARLQF